jgi:hypothetical protein
MSVLAWTPARPPLRLSWRLGLLGAMAMSALATCVWRAQAGQAFVPGLFTVVCVPLSVLLFVVADRMVRFRLGQWIGVSGLIAAHLVLSVPSPSGPLYYRGTHLLRPDHVVHAFAGGLVAWLVFELVSPCATRWKLAPAAVAFIVFSMTMCFGAMKEVTDFLSVQASGLPHDAQDTLLDFVSNGLGAAVLVLGRLPFIAVDTPEPPG